MMLLWRGTRLARKTVLIIGLGEVGHALYELLKESERFTVYGFDIDETKMRELGFSFTDLPKQADTIHICYPCDKQEKFIGSVTENVKRFKPKLVIIDSTVPPETTTKVHKRCSCLVAHSPVRGVHRDIEHMKWELKRWTKYVGGTTVEAGKATSLHFEKAGFKTKILASSLETELAKLFETTYRAWMIACFQEMHRISRHFGAVFDDVVDFIEDTHRVRSDRPVMFPGVIGGHCLVPNVKLLSDDYDSQFLRLILESNQKRKEEIKDGTVAGEIEIIKRRLERSEESNSRS
jgi:UDP-N-acetyl-D-mannosaminuronate dehydrogenase